MVLSFRKEKGLSMEDLTNLSGHQRGKRSLGEEEGHHSMEWDVPGVPFWEAE